MRPASKTISPSSRSTSCRSETHIACCAFAPGPRMFSPKKRRGSAGGRRRLTGSSAYHASPHGVPGNECVST